MEQQREDWETLSYLGNEVRVRFLRGCYSCEGVKGSYSTIENLKKAWVEVLTEKKRIELMHLAKKLRKADRKARRGYAEGRNYLLREMKLWQIKKIIKRG